MPRADEMGDDRVESLFGRVLDASGDIASYDERFVHWLERSGAQPTRAEDLRIERIARSMAVRVAGRVRALQGGARLTTTPLRARAADVVGSIASVADRAAAVRCAPWLDSLAVAAGTGRELWDEECDRWVELPRELERGRYLALGVAGDSMEPHLCDGDVIVVDPQSAPVEHAIVVARRRDDGYVVKYVSKVTRRSMELSSFNVAYEPFSIARTPGSFVGTVIARLTRHRDVD